MAKQNYLDPYRELIINRHFQPYLHSNTKDRGFKAHRRPQNKEPSNLDINYLETNIPTFTKDEQLIAAAYVLSHAGTSANQKNWVWEKYGNDTKQRNIILGILDGNGYSTCLIKQFNYLPEIVDYLITNKKIDGFIEYLLYVDEDPTKKLKNNIHNKITNVTGTYLWNNLQKFTNIIQNGDVGDISNIQLYEVLIKNMSFKEWLETKPTLVKIKQVTKLLLTTEYGQGKVDEIINTFESIKSLAYVKNNKQTLELCGIDRFSPLYIKMLLDKPYEPSVDATIPFEM